MWRVDREEPPERFTRIGTAEPIRAQDDA